MRLRFLCCATGGNRLAGVKEAEKEVKVSGSQSSAEKEGKEGFGEGKKKRGGTLTKQRRRGR